MVKYMACFPWNNLNLLKFGAVRGKNCTVNVLELLCYIFSCSYHLKMWIFQLRVNNREACEMSVKEAKRPESKHLLAHSMMQCLNIKEKAIVLTGVSSVLLGSDQSGSWKNDIFNVYLLGFKLNISISQSLPLWLNHPFVLFVFNWTSATYSIHTRYSMPGCNHGGRMFSVPEDIWQQLQTKTMKNTIAIC